MVINKNEDIPISQHPIHVRNVIDKVDCDFIIVNFLFSDFNRFQTQIKCQKM